VRTLVDELARWFVGHAQMMDAALAEVMLERGYDPDTGRMHNPPAADGQPPSPAAAAQLLLSRRGLDSPHGEPW
jgi:hemerythrin